MKKVSIFLLLVLFSALVAMVAKAQPSHVKEKTEQSAAIATATHKSFL